MKHIKKFEKFKFLDIKEIIFNLEEILINLKDINLDYEIYPTNDIKLKMISLKLQNLLDDIENDKRIEPLKIEISKIKYNKNVDIIINSIQRINHYLNDIGLRIVISITYLNDERSYVDLEGLEEELISSYIDKITILVEK